jgi:hypothetical protein
VNYGGAGVIVRRKRCRIRPKSFVLGLRCCSMGDLWDQTIDRAPGAPPTGNGSESDSGWRVSPEARFQCRYPACCRYGDFRRSSGRSPAARFLAHPSWLSVIDLSPPLSPLAIWRLGHGESEVLEYARRTPGTTAILDDKAARRVALALHIPLTGTVGLLVAAVRNKLLPSLRDAIDAVRAGGLYADPVTAASLTDERT